MDFAVTVDNRSGTLPLDALSPFFCGFRVAVRRARLTSDVCPLCVPTHFQRFALPPEETIKPRVSFPS